MLISIGCISADKKFEKPKPKECVKACPQTFDPICAGNPDSPSDRKLSFGNQCVLSNYNCENNASKLKLYTHHIKSYLTS